AFAISGLHIDRMARYDQGSDRRWEALDNSYRNDVVECEDDNGIHGNGVDATKRYPANGGNAAGYWGSTATLTWGQGRLNTTYTIYSGNYLNWWYGPTVQRTRMDVVKEVSTNLLSTIQGINVGLMHFNDNEGGRIAYAMEDIETARSAIQEKIVSLNAGTWTPLSDTLYESVLYCSGGNVYYGTASVSTSRATGNPSRYQTPIADPCQKNFVVLLTDG